MGRFRNRNENKEEKVTMVSNRFSDPYGSDYKMRLKRSWWFSLIALVNIFIQVIVFPEYTVMFGLNYSYAIIAISVAILPIGITFIMQHYSFGRSITGTSDEPIALFGNGVWVINGKSEGKVDNSVIDTGWILGDITGESNLREFSERIDAKRNEAMKELQISKDKLSTIGSSEVLKGKESSVKRIGEELNKAVSELEPIKTSTENKKEPVVNKKKKGRPKKVIKNA
jgi:hypothetical protein